MCDKMAISADILKIVVKDPFLRLQMRAKKMFAILRVQREKLSGHQTNSYHVNDLLLASIIIEKMSFYFRKHS